ncbi:DNA-binding protein [Marinicella pacifica]|uniref:DNA-binding protein n=1 Tax=Marinicella pacifica TaxID=1171543 RepID=A0A917FUD7_9GAMM|nr:cold shock and DUF1294 domain-containing protein [Marinicella pacifica]GGG03596.1 DNA-binding protein [Marinicella pacifica]
MKTQSGQILNWNTEKGFGFIQPDAGGKHVFAHINDYSQRHKPPVKGLAVNYALSEDSKGRACAVNVIPIKGHKKSGIHTKQKNFAAILAVVFSLFLAVIYFSKIIPIHIVGIYVVMSFLTFLLYAHDKKAAGRDAWRTQESTLHLFSILGGWPGALLAQAFIRHKSKKLSFKIVLWLTVLINCVVLYWLITSDGKLSFDAVVIGLNDLLL